MKTLHAPYLPELETLHDANAIMTLLDTEGVREQIAEHPWPEYPYIPLTAFTMAHSGEAIYIDFFVRCNYLRAENYTNQSPVSQDSCVEFFVSPRPEDNQRLYYNFEFNCIGTVNASHRERREAPTRLTDSEIAQIGRYASCGTRPFCEMEGIFSWSLLVRIPLSLLGVTYRPGEPLTMRANFYKCASATSAPHYLTWAPVHSDKPNFHRPEDFGELVLD